MSFPRVDSWRKIDESWLEPQRSERMDWRPLIALVTVALALTFLYYDGSIDGFVQHFPKRWQSETGLMQSLWWTSAAHMAALVILPLLAMALMPGEHIVDYLRAAGRMSRRTWPYLAFIAIGLPLLLLLSGHEEAIKFYPFEVFDQRASVDKATWLALTAAQVLSVEFFFRCFLLRAIGARFGSGAIFVMLVPYSMLLYGKPMKEFAVLMLMATAFATYLMRDPGLLSANRRAEHAGTAMGGVARELARVPRWIHSLSIGSWQHIDREWIETRAKGSFDWRPVIVLVTVAISLMLQETYGDRGTFAELFPKRFASEYGVLMSFAWWSGWRVFGYVVLPILAICVMPGERIRDYFISFRGVIKHLWIYFGLFALVLPAVLIAARSPSFLQTYPFYKMANRSSFDFWMWEALYAAQFLSLEFFFRGFILKATAPRFGSAAIFVMIVPYCIIHFGKPMSETLAALIAGTVLGTLALRTRSIWGGVLIHVGVAVTMDLLALSHCPPADSGLQCPRH